MTDAFTTIRYGAYSTAKVAYDEIVRRPVQSRALRDVIDERARQVEKGFTAAHDDVHTKGEIASAALNYVAASALSTRFGFVRWNDDVSPPLHDVGLTDGINWPWHPSWWRPGLVRRMLIKAIALLIAEVERLDRLGEAPQIAAERALLQIEAQP